ncbi:hypothetical protein niasHT_019807 [Heterodera trifolii]|uniref:Uncharacterized protein n=1 Tax=Heterodera trifolii TaxID=157864 RepID=A0ABD2KUR2_9BILA
MAPLSALLLLLPMLLNVQKIPDECVRSDMDAVYSAISALGPWKSQAETLAQICSQLSIAQAALLVKMHCEFLASKQNGREAKAPTQFDLALFAEALEATVEMDDEGKEVKLRWEKLNEWATKMWEKAEKEGDKAEKHADKAESEGDKTEKAGGKAEKEGEKAEKHADKAEKEADKAENEEGKAEKEGDEEEEGATKGGEMPETFTKAELKAEENGEKEEKKDPGGEVRMEFRRRKDENGNEEVVVTFVKKMEENGGPSKREEEEELEEELRKEEMVPKLDKEKGINANSALPMVQEFNMVTNRTNTSSKSGANLDKPADKENGISANLARPVVPKADTANDNNAKPAIPMVPELDMITNNSSNSDANLAKPVVPKVGMANDNNAKPTMPIMIPDIFLPSQHGKLSAFEKAHERRKMLKKSLSSNRSFRRQKRKTAGMENAVENVVSVKDEQQQIFVSIEKLTTLGMMGDGLGFLTKVTNLEIVVAKAGKQQQAKAVPSSDSMAVNWTGERDRTENGGTNWTVERGEIESGSKLRAQQIETESGANTVARVGTENEETNWTVERDGTENESDILSNLTVEQIGTENVGAEMEMESHGSPKDLPIENSDGNWEKKAAIKAYLEHGMANANGHKKWEKLAMVWYSELLYWTAKWIETLKNRMAGAKPELAQALIFSNTGLAAFEELKNEVIKCVEKMINLKEWIGNVDKK